METVNPKVYMVTDVTSSLGKAIALRERFEIQVSADKSLSMRWILAI